VAVTRTRCLLVLLGLLLNLLVLPAQLISMPGPTLVFLAQMECLMKRQDLGFDLRS
jgi:hypothetical protein